MSSSFTEKTTPTSSRSKVDDKSDDGQAGSKVGIHSALLTCVNEFNNFKFINISRICPKLEVRRPPGRQEQLTSQIWTRNRAL